MLDSSLVFSSIADVSFFSASLGEDRNKNSIFLRRGFRNRYYVVSCFCLRKSFLFIFFLFPFCTSSFSLSTTMLLFFRFSHVNFSDKLLDDKIDTQKAFSISRSLYASFISTSFLALSKLRVSLRVRMYAQCQIFFRFQSIDVYSIYCH